MDEADRASQETERELAEAMRLRRPAGPQPTGRCLYCDEIVPEHPPLLLQPSGQWVELSAAPVQTAPRSSNC